MQTKNNGVDQYGDTFIEGVIHNQRKSDERLKKALLTAQGLGESKEFVQGMMIALRVLRGESYERRVTEQ